MKNSRVLGEQPYDQELLRKSKIYFLSRKLYLSQKGTFCPRLLSADRSLESATLISNIVEYSPLASELEWSMSERTSKERLKRVGLMRDFITNVFHEQNHRTLWTHFKKAKIYCPQTPKAASFFLNFAESLVISLDMALGDELRPEDSHSLHAMLVIYSHGLDQMRKLKPGTKAYRNALQVALLTTHLRLCGLPINTIVSKVRKNFLNYNQDDVDFAIQRALRMQPSFVETTNPEWQKDHIKKVMAAFKPPHVKNVSKLSVNDFLNFELIFKMGEAWFKKFGL